jgi:hypothetical protein
MSTRQYVARLQAEMKTLQAENQRLKNASEEAISHLKQCDQMARNLVSENQAARRIIWAAAHNNGGRLEILDSSMQMAADDSNEIASYYNPEKAATVFQAKTRTEAEEEIEENKE